MKQIDSRRVGSQPAWTHAAIQRVDRQSASYPLPLFRQYQYGRFSLDQEYSVTTSLEQGSKLEGMEGRTMDAGKRLIAVILFGMMALSSAAAQSAAANAENAGLPAQYSATAIGQGGTTAGKTFDVNIYVTGVTTDEERQELVAVLKEKGPDGLLSALQKKKDLGRLAPIGTVGTGVRFVRIRPTPEGGQHIVMVTDRPISIAERYRGTRSNDYPFGVVVMNVDKSGQGTGTLAPVCKIKFNKKNELEVEHYGQKPFRLANLRRVK
jgi:hypothetical protein